MFDLAFGSETTCIKMEIVQAAMSWCCFPPHFLRWLLLSFSLKHTMLVTHQRPDQSSQHSSILQMLKMQGVAAGVLHVTNQEVSLTPPAGHLRSLRLSSIQATLETRVRSYLWDPETSNSPLYLHKHVVSCHNFCVVSLNCFLHTFITSYTLPPTTLL